MTSTLAVATPDADRVRPTLGQLLQGGGGGQVDIQTFLTQLATSPQAATEEEKERQRKEMRRTRKRKRLLMTASVAAAASALPCASPSPPPHVANDNKNKKTAGKRQRKNDSKKARANSAAEVELRRVEFAKQRSAVLPQGNAHQPGTAVRAQPPPPQPLLCADAECGCRGAPYGRELWERDHFALASALYDRPSLPSSSSFPSLPPGIDLARSPSLSPSPSLPSLLGGWTSSPPQAVRPLSFSASVSSSSAPAPEEASFMPPSLSWVDSFFTSLGEMTDLVEPADSVESLFTFPHPIFYEHHPATYERSSSASPSFSSTPSSSSSLPLPRSRSSPSLPYHPHLHQHTSAYYYRPVTTDWGSSVTAQAGPLRPYSYASAEANPPYVAPRTRHGDHPHQQHAQDGFVTHPAYPVWP